VENVDSPQDRRAHAKAVRLIFRYEGDSIELISQERVEMVVPPSDAIGSTQGRAGFWLDLQNNAGETMFRRVMPHAVVHRDAEVFSDDPRQTITRVPVEKPGGTVVALVPDLPQGEQVALFRSSPAPDRPQALTLASGAAAAQPQEIARFTLQK